MLRYKSCCLIPLLGVLLSACSLFGVQSGDNARHRQAMEQRSEALAKLNSWQLKGRIVITTPDEAWSGQLHWLQNNKHYEIFFNAPTGQGALHLLGDPLGIELQLANGDVHRATDADALLYENTGWKLPLDALWFWVRGMPSPRFKQFVLYDAQGNIESLEQGHWLVEFDRYHSYQGYNFPRKIVIKNAEEIKLKLLVQRWQLG